MHETLGVKMIILVEAFGNQKKIIDSLSLYIFYLYLNQISNFKVFNIGISKAYLLEVFLLYARI